MSDLDHDLYVQHAVSHMDHMKHFYNEKMHFDIDIVVGDKRYPVHKMMLLTASEYFRNRLNRNMNELLVENSEGIREETVKKTIQFLYEGTLELKLHQVANIVKFAEILQFCELKNFCYLYLKNKLSNYDHISPVFKQIDEILKNDFSKVMMHKEFLNMSFDKVKTLLESDDLQISSEVEVFKGLTLWLKKDWNNRKQHFFALMKCIRLHLCPLSFILNEVVEFYCKQFNECHLLYVAIQWHRMPKIRSSLSLMEPRNILNDNVLIVGGHDSSIAGVIEIYNPVLNTWTEFYNTGEKNIYSAYVILNATLLMLGGRRKDNQVTNEVKCLNLSTKELTDLKPMQQNRQNATVNVVDGMVFIIGGYNDEEKHLNTVEQWNPITKTWTFMSPMHYKRRCPVSVVHKKEIYVLGGHSGFDFLQSAEVYSPKTDKWRRIGTMNEKRFAFAAVVHKNQLYALGGFNGSSDLNAVERFDPESNIWSQLKDLPELLRGQSAVVLNDRIICFGGYLSSSMTEYNPDTNVWKKLGNMAKYRIYYNALPTNLKFI